VEVRRCSRSERRSGDAKRGDLESGGSLITDLQLGVLERIDAREAWKSEPYEFTPWLRQNIHLLGKAIGIEIDVDVQQEVAVGLFSADLLGTDVSSNASVLIENQLEQTDHAHLGQLLTYAGGLGTDILIWVSTKVREEHRQALTWLNEKTHEDVLFFAVEVELLRIDGSRPAPHFKVVVAPNEWQKTGSSRASGAGGAATTERQELYKSFWRALLKELLARDPASTTASPDRVHGSNYYGISVGRSYFQANFVFGWEEGQYVLRAELYIDTPDKLQNEAVFDHLFETRAMIETEFGEELVWSRREDIRACRIYARRFGSIEDSQDQLDDYVKWGAERLLKIRQVFGSRVKSLVLPVPIPTHVDPAV
jgi:hypothetical protein